MKVLLIVLVCIFFVMLAFLSSTVVVYGEETVDLKNLRFFMLSTLLLAVVIAGMIYYDQASASTETTVTDFPLALYIEDGKPDEPTNLYVRELGTEDDSHTYSFCFYDIAAEKVMKGVTVGEKNVEFVINSNATPTLRFIESRVRHKITGREYVVSYYVFIVPNEEAISFLGETTT